tara:strand:- start:12 stop:590 length:579 start_codon:yes stop_codon:yes gene_type:complete
MFTTIKDNKNNQRKILEKKRILLQKEKGHTSKNLIRNLINFDKFNKYKIIASFVSIKTEISTLTLNNYIIEQNKILCLPVIKKESNKLIFRKHDMKKDLIEGRYGVKEPNVFNKELLPELIFTPCLAFDEIGYRLGYGGGYYDRTFSYFQKIKHKFISVAVAFDDQKIEKVISDSNDQKIDYILTEKKLYKV